MLNRDHQLDTEALLPGRSTEAGATRRTALQAALGLGYAAVPLVGAALAAGGLGLVWLGNTRRRPFSVSSSITVLISFSSF